jgi:hypothetical protein
LACSADKGRDVARLLAVLVLLLGLASPARAATEWQIRPLAGLTFGGGNSLVDLTGGGRGRTKGIVGVNGGLIGEIFGIDVDLAHAPGFFDGASQALRLVTSSEVTTLTGSVVVGVPKSRTVYTLRPYFVGGLGVMHASADDYLAVFGATLTRPAVNVGGGATGFISDRIGLNWELRYFRSLGGGNVVNGTSFGPERLSFWRANMALVVKLR